MKNVYIALIIISLICISGDSPSFWGWILWELIWGTVFAVSAYKLERRSHDGV